MLPKKENKRYDIGYGNGHWFGGNGGDCNNDRCRRPKQTINKHKKEEV